MNSAAGKHCSYPVLHTSHVFVAANTLVLLFFYFC